MCKGIYKKGEIKADGLIAMLNEQYPMGGPTESVEGYMNAD